MELNHTPGPWEVSEENGYFPSVFLGPRLRYSDNSGSFRASICINEGPTPEDVKSGFGFATTMGTCKANAQLIAAAPQLLNVLREFVADIDANSIQEWPNLCITYRKALQVIEQATGIKLHSSTPVAHPPVRT